MFEGYKKIYVLVLHNKNTAIKLQKQWIDSIIHHNCFSYRILYHFLIPCRNKENCLLDVLSFISLSFIVQETIHHNKSSYHKIKSICSLQTRKSVTKISWMGRQGDCNTESLVWFHIYCLKQICSTLWPKQRVYFFFNFYVIAMNISF